MVLDTITLVPSSPAATMPTEMSPQPSVRLVPPAHYWRVFYYSALEEHNLFKSSQVVLVVLQGAAA